MMNTRTLLPAALALGALAMAAAPAHADGGSSSISSDGTSQLAKLNQLGQVTQVTKAADPSLGLLAPVTGLVPS
jgi:hypothetical protein